jgi:hypothetical protein
MTSKAEKRRKHKLHQEVEREKKQPRNEASIVRSEKRRSIIRLGI